MLKMVTASVGGAAPFALAAAALIRPNAASLLFLLAFAFTQYRTTRRDWYLVSSSQVWTYVLLLAAGVIVAEVAVQLSYLSQGEEWAHSRVAKFWLWLLGYDGPGPWRDSSVLALSLGPQLGVILTAACALYSELHYAPWRARRLAADSSMSRWRKLARHVGFPAAVLLAGALRPSLVAALYFLFACVSLSCWATVRTFNGFFWAWRPLLLYCGAHSLLLYLFQFPVVHTSALAGLAQDVGLYQIDTWTSGAWPELGQAAALLLLFVMLSGAISHRLATGEDEPPVLGSPLNGVSTDEDDVSPTLSRSNSLTTSLLEREMANARGDSSTPWVVRQRRVAVHWQALRSFYTYGFPLCLVALVTWSFVDICVASFGLLVFVAFVFFSFPSSTRLQRTNPIMLAYILLWTLAMYFFNAAGVRDPDAFWTVIGLWRYHRPGGLILAQFLLAGLMALDVYTRNIVLEGDAEEEAEADGAPQGRQSLYQEAPPLPEAHGHRIFVFALASYCIRKSAHVGALVVLFFVGISALDLLHAIYMVFFLVYLVFPRSAKVLSIWLVTYCEVHFAVLYLFRLAWFQGLRTDEWRPILDVIGLWRLSVLKDFAGVAALLCFSAVQYHGVRSLKQLEGENFRDRMESHWSTAKLTEMVRTVNRAYRQWGIYIAYVTALLVVYTVPHSFVGFTYLAFLLTWVIANHAVNNVRHSRLWVPFMVFLGVVGVLRYVFGAFPSLLAYVMRTFGLSRGVMQDIGFDTGSAPLIEKLWDCAVLLCTVQMYRYNRSISGLDEDSVEDPGEEPIEPVSGILAFLKRLVIIHAHKAVAFAVFYAALSPVSLVGFVYLLFLVVTCLLPKTSQTPPRVYIIYTALLAAAGYLFQILGHHIAGTRYERLLEWIGFEVWGEGFYATEAGLLSKVLVLAASVLQLVSLAWLDSLPPSLKGDANDVEPCSLFASHAASAAPSAQTPPSLRPVNQLTPIRTARRSSDTKLLRRGRPETEPLLGDPPTSESGKRAPVPRTPPEPSETASFQGVDVAETPTPPRLSTSSSAGVRALKWARRAHQALKQERYQAQLRSVKVHLKHCAEHFFLFQGLELTMLVLLFAAFAVLNVFSLVYVAILGACVVMERRSVRRVWPYLVGLFAGILLAEYAILGGLPWGNNGGERSCHGCWDCTEANDRHCWMCWLGAAADEKQMIAAHFLVFLLAAYQHRVHVALGDTPAGRYRPVPISAAMKDAWRPMTYDSVNQWTWLDHVRFWFYRHLLLLVLTLVFATGSLNYDLLHFGYLAFSLVFFRIRSQIMDKGNAILNFLRLYNFLLIIASLIYQAPAFEYKTARSCSLPYDIWNIIGLYKYEYGVTMSAQGALVDMIIFSAVALQSWVFTTPEHAQVRQYLEAEEMYARAQAHERRADWKKQELQRIQRTEEVKRNRRAQVNKMKKDIVQMKTRLDFLNSAVTPSPQPSFELQEQRVEGRPASRKLDFASETPPREPSLATPPGRRPEGLALQRRTRSMESVLGTDGGSSKEAFGSPEIEPEALYAEPTVPARLGNGRMSQLDRATSDSEVARRNVRLLAGMHFLGDGITQVQTLGNRALANLVDYLKLDEEQDEAEGELFGAVPIVHAVDAEDPVLNESPRQREEKPSEKPAPALRRSGSWPRSVGEEPGRKKGEGGSVGDSMRQLGIIAGYVARLLRANTHVVCYALFVVVFVWNFSLLTSAYGAALFGYVLLASPGPGGVFWLGVLIYTEFNILVQYTYQIPVSNSCKIVDPASGWAKLIEYCGIRSYQNSFFLSVLPLFLVYLATLVHSSLTKRDGEWTLVSGDTIFGSRKRTSRDIETGSSFGSGLTGFATWTGSLLHRFRMFWQGIVSGCEAPPHFVLLTMRVSKWPEGGIQPESIEAGMNRLLAAVHTEGARFGPRRVNTPSGGSLVRVESIDQSPDRPNEAVAVLEVLHVAAPRKPGSKETLTPAADVAAEVQRMREEKREQVCGFPYPIESVVAGGRREVDLYAYVFFADMLSFFFVALFYQSAVGAHKSIFAAAYEQDQFPKEFVYVLLTLFSLMAIDRILYLCSFARAKLVYYFASLLLFTGYTVRLFWNPRLVDGRMTFQLFFLLRALSLGLTATQIKYGPPRDSAHGQFLMRRVDYLHSVGFTIYRVLPFVYELRTVLDWSCANTALMLYDWLKMEDIYASLYTVTCDLKLNRERHKLGSRQEFAYKFWSGFVVFLALCTTIWAPMVLFSTGNPTNYYNPIQDVRMAVYLDTQEGTFPVYEAGARRRIEFYKPAEDAFLQPFDVHEIQLVCCFSDADAIWQVPPPTQRSLVKILAQPAQLRTVWTFTRARPLENAVVANGTDYSRESPQEVADMLSRVLNGTADAAGFPHLYPKYFRLPGLGPPRALEGTQDVFVGGNLTFHGGPTPWWSFERFPAEDDTDRDDCRHEGGPMAVAVSEEVPGGFIGTTLSKFGLAGLYITFVLGVHRLVRLQSSDLRMRIPYENFPSCDRLVAICEDIYAARAEGELELEEGLFWTLIKIYRSPHILMEYTKADKVD